MLNIIIIFVLYSIKIVNCESYNKYSGYSIFFNSNAFNCGYSGYSNFFNSNAFNSGYSGYSNFFNSNAFNSGNTGYSNVYNSNLFSYSKSTHQHYLTFYNSYDLQSRKSYYSFDIKSSKKSNSVWGYIS